MYVGPRFAPFLDRITSRQANFPDEQQHYDCRAEGNENGTSYGRMASYSQKVAEHETYIRSIEQAE